MGISRECSTCEPISMLPSIKGGFYSKDHGHKDKKHYKKVPWMLNCENSWVRQLCFGFYICQSVFPLLEKPPSIYVSSYSPPISTLFCL